MIVTSHWQVVSLRLGIRGLPVTCQRPVIVRLRVRLGGLRPLLPLTRIWIRVAAQAFTGKSESGRTEFKFRVSDRRCQN